MLLGLILLPPLAAEVASTSSSSATTTLPNIVLILTDDQRSDTLGTPGAALPNIQSELMDHGISFSNSFVVNSLCCPSRSSILTGKYSHTTGVYKNEMPNGGYKSFNATSTVATWLHGAGYRTGLIGKYLNGYKTANAATIPPGWDRWFVLAQGKTDTESAYYLNYSVSDQGALVSYGGTDADYSTDVFASQADSFIRTTSGSQPLFLELATAAPHSPATPPSRYSTSFSTLTPYRPPNYNEADVSDKPAYIRALSKLGSSARSNIDAFRINQYRTLLGVDDAVGKVVQALQDTGRLANTMIVFYSDNGLTWAEHRWKKGKLVPYEESIRVPLVIRYDPYTQSPGSTDAHPVTNIDLAPTFAELAGVTAPGAEGTSLMPLITGTSTGWRTDLLIEHLQGTDPVPSFCAVRNEQYMFATYGTGEQELYDLSADPYELTNQIANPSYAGTASSLRARDQQLCTPVPPGFAFDKTPPSTPTGLTATTPSSTEVDLSWTASTDNIGVTGYTIYRDGNVIGTVSGSTLSFPDTTVSPGTTYTYTVDAFDLNENHSPQSDPVSVTTPSGP